MPVYEFECKFCNKEFEEFYHINDPIPTICPLCGAEGGIKRLISMPAGVKVELTGKELIQQLRAEGKAIAKECRKNETLAHNIFGSNK